MPINWKKQAESEIVTLFDELGNQIEVLKNGSFSPSEIKFLNDEVRKIRKPSDVAIELLLGIALEAKISLEEAQERLNNNNVPHTLAEKYKELSDLRNQNAEIDNEIACLYIFVLLKRNNKDIVLSDVENIKSQEMFDKLFEFAQNERLKWENKEAKEAKEEAAKEDTEESLKKK